MPDYFPSKPLALPLTEALVQRNIAPLFSRTLANDCIYLMAQSLGRPLDRMAEDVQEALALCYAQPRDPWERWLTARDRYRSLIACLLHAASMHCVAPTPSAGEGLRIVLNALGAGQKAPLEVLTTTGEFTSTQLILHQYAAAGRIKVRYAAADEHGYFALPVIIDAITADTRLVVISEVMFQTGQRISPLDQLAEACHAQNAYLLVDAYHSAGALPVDVQQMRADFMIGGCYKYLRGGPGVAFLYLSPEALEAGLIPLDAGWFALHQDRMPQDFSRAALRPGGDAFLGDTPAVLPWYQARSGLEFTLTIGVDRLRAYSLRQLRFLRSALEDAGVRQVQGADHLHGGFLVVRHAKSALLAEVLREQKIMVNARGEYLRLGPDCLTRQDELLAAARALGGLLTAMST